MITGIIWGCIALALFIVAGNGVRMFIQSKSSERVVSGVMFFLFGTIFAFAATKISVSYFMAVL